MRRSIKLESEMAGEIHWGAPGAVLLDGFLYVQESWEHYDESRWSQIHEFVIKRTDQRDAVTYWRAYIEQGLTENQPNSDFQDEDEIEFVQVDKIPTVTYRYEEVSVADA